MSGIATDCPVNPKKDYPVLRTSQELKKKEVCLLFVTTISQPILDNPEDLRLKYYYWNNELFV